MNPWLVGGGMALDALGKALGGGAQARAQREQQKLSRDELNWQQMGDTVSAQRTLDDDKYRRTNQNMVSPARQQVLQALASRLGLGGALQFGGQGVASQARNPLGEQLGRAWQGSEDPNKRGFAQPGGYVQTGVDPVAAQQADGRARVKEEIRQAQGRMGPRDFAQWLGQNRARLEALAGGGL